MWVLLRYPMRESERECHTFYIFVLVCLAVSGKKYPSTSFCVFKKKKNLLLRVVGFISMLVIFIFYSYFTAFSVYPSIYYLYLLIPLQAHKDLLESIPAFFG